MFSYMFYFKEHQRNYNMLKDTNRKILAISILNSQIFSPYDLNSPQKRLKCIKARPRVFCIENYCEIEHNITYFQHIKFNVKI